MTYDLLEMPVSMEYFLECIANVSGVKCQKLFCQRLRYGVRCVVVGKTPFTWRDDTKVLSKEAPWNFLTESLSVRTDVLRQG